MEDIGFRTLLVHSALVPCSRSRATKTNQPHHLHKLVVVGNLASEMITRQQSK